MRNSFQGVLIVVGCCASAFASAAETALDRYIAKPDAAYEWSLHATLEGEGFTGYVLNLTSQTWRSEKDVDRPVWTHWLTIAVPDIVEHDTALLYIGGGNNGDDAPDKVNERTATLATTSNSIVAQLGMVPNQPLHFADSKKHGRHEDDLIAYTRVKYIVTGDEEWLVRLAMVKSGVRAMDAIQEFAGSVAGGGHAINSFVVSGGSKRAWTTWLVGAVDERVRAIVPFVIDALNTEAITRHHFAAYGFFSTALGDYVRHGLYPSLLGTREMDEILEIEDPYMYRKRDRLKIPKYVINASGDQYFLPDNSRFYFLDMPDEKHLRYVPNAKHDLEGSDARESMLAFYLSVLHDTERPSFTWKIKRDGTIVVKADEAPMEANLWQATNAEARDFRLDTIGDAWTKSSLHGDGGKYVANIDAPDRGYTAFFVELVYDSGFEFPFKFTTDVSVVPDILPFSLDGVTEIELK